MNLLDDINNPLWEEKGVIYCYTNLINNKKYIGQTTTTLKSRHKKHIYSSLDKNHNGYNIIFHKAIRKYRIENFSLKILVMNCNDKSKLNEYEKFFIKRYKTLFIDGKGYNCSEGGDGNPFYGKTKEEVDEIRFKISKSLTGIKRTDEFKNKVSISSKKRFDNDEERQQMSDIVKNTWMNMTQEQKDERCKKISNSNKGKIMSEDARKKMSKSKKGKTGSNANRSKQIGQYDEDGNLIKIFVSGKQASEELHILRSSISQCCSGKTKYVRVNGNKFTFKFIEEVD